jgi:AraC-like DNA-binding protein
MHAILPSNTQPSSRCSHGSLTATSPQASVSCGAILRESLEQAVQPLLSRGCFEIQQLEAGDCKGRIEYAHTAETLIFREECPRKFFVSGRLNHDCFGIAMPLEGHPAIVGGQTLKEGLAATAIEGEEIRWLAQPGSKHLVVTVRRSRLQELIDLSENAAALRTSLEPGRRGMVLPIRSDAMRPLLRLLDRVATKGVGMDADTFDELVHSTVLAAIDPTDHAFGRPPAMVLFRRALALAEDQTGTPRVAELSASLKVSPRTLHKAFYIVAGVGPAAFFLNRQLHQARKLLQQANPTSAKISSIAAQLGVTELGRFSVRYRRLFGESPSVTLRRSRIRTR